MKILLFLVCLVVLYFIGDTARTVYLISRSKGLIDQAVPFHRSVENASMRILVMGDSTAYGTGSELSEVTTAGRLGQLYPDAEIVNRSVNGLKINGLLKILEGIDDSEHFDIVLIQIGANDIIRMTSMKNVQEGIQTIMNRAKIIGDTVIVLHSGDVGEAKFFPLYARPLLTHRSKKMRDIYIDTAEQEGVHYIDLMNSPIAETLRADPARYYAPDWLHLSGAGYGLWMQEISKFLPQK